MLPDREFLIKQRQIEEWRREAQRDRMVREALQARNAERRTGGPGWQALPTYVYNRALTALGQRFVQLGMWMQRHCVEARSPFTYQKACVE